MKGTGKPELDQLLGLIDVISQMAAELPESETRGELIAALSIALVAALRLRKERRLAGRSVHRL